MADHTPLLHGGDLIAASQRYGIALEKWVDLSTGINPHGYPVSAIPAQAWQRLPLRNEAMLAAATHYYGNPHLLPACGTQAILQALPRLRPPCRVAIPTPTYAEHPKAWERCGHAVTRYTPEHMTQIAANHDVLLLCNPNNPTGHRYTHHELLDCHSRLATHGGWLIVDEAFIDATPEDSIAASVGLPGLIVLRSLGKFFGLAGARVGFALAWPELLSQLEELLGPWPISGPSQLAAQQALADTAWQQATHTKLLQEAQRLVQLLTQHQLSPTGGTALFQWVNTPCADAIHHQLAAQGILTRLFTETSSLRFGIPGTEHAWQQLASILKTTRFTEPTAL